MVYSANNCPSCNVNSFVVICRSQQETLQLRAGIVPALFPFHPFTSCLSVAKSVMHITIHKNDQSYMTSDGAMSLGLSGLSDNGSHRLIYLDAYSPGSITISEVLLGVVALLEECIT